tara:strand:+ start:287 stop:1054 length:768 start_codon:yes stop_codon:yes gene_type:complete
METKVRVPKIEKNWQIKDRTYILTGGKAPLSWTIQSKHTARKPLLWFDEELNEQRELRYASNQKSLFVDEQKGNATLAHVIFLDGVLEVPKHQQALQKLLSLYHPKAGEIWQEVDEEANAMDEVDNIEFELEALNLVKTLDIEHLEAIMRTELGSAVVNMSTKELKRDAYLFARKDPELFIEISNDDDIKLRNLANRAVEKGIIELTDENTIFRFANGKKIMQVPFDQNPYGALAQYFKTDEGVDLMKSITKKLS